MELLIQSLILLFSLAILSKSSHFLTESSVKIARITGLGERVIGFILLALVASGPEIAIAFSAILSGNIGISLGNIFGSNIADILLVIGIMALLARIKIYKKTLAKLSIALFLASLISFSLLVAPFYSRAIGLALIFVFIIFCYFFARERINIKEFMERRKKIEYSTILILTLSIFFLLLSSRFVVDSAASITKIIGISEAVIGGSIISIGSVLPELAVGITSIRKKYIGLALGNAIGSCVVKVTIVLGLLFSVSLFPFDFALYSTFIAFMIVSSLLFWFVCGRGEIDKFDGILFLLFYIIFLAMLFGVEISF